MKVLVLADDLTGASDTVVSFARSGWSALLSLSGGWATMPQEDAIAVSLDTRRDPRAAEITERAVADLAGDRLYLKIDSTIRGRVAEQVRGALKGRRASRPGSFVVLCPAYPAMGRTVEDGLVLVAGVPVHEGPAGSDPVTPVTTSDLRSLVPGSALAEGPDLVAAIRDAAEDHDVVIVDARDQADLERLAAAIAEIGPDAVPVGSAGLATAVARVWHDQAADRPGSIAVPPDSRALVVVSSLHEVARAQVADLQARAAGSDLRVDLLVTSEELEDGAAERRASDIARQAAATLASGHHALLVLVGGDGAAQTLLALGATGIRVVDALVEGVPVGTIVGGSHDGLVVATKAGGFGDPQTITQLIGAVRAQGEPMHKLPVLGLTIGDVAGIGPEITLRTLLEHPDLREECVPVVIGDAASLRRAAVYVGVDPAVVVTIDHPAQATNNPALVEVVQIGESIAEVPIGELSPVAGDGSYRFVVAACDLAKEGAIDGIVTAPLNKAAMHAGGHKYPGHTELLAEQFGVENFSLVLSAGDLYFFHLTTHVSLAQAIAGITPERTTDVLDLAHAFAEALGRPETPIAVAGLNPHAGENRLFGDEDADVLEPAILRAQERGIDARGPLPADAVIPQAVRGKWELVVVCYHDQGHAPFKAVYGDDGVNITVGLPVVRVSVDHGTAFDIAGTGVAREASLVLATRRAAALAPGWDAVWRTAQRVDA